jgi:hypothetical protein
MDDLQDYRPWAEVEEEQDNEYDFPYDTSDDDGVNEGLTDGVNEGEEPLEELPEGDAAAEETPTEEEINVSFFLADALRQKGILNLDNVPENITEEEVVQLYAQSHEERIQQTILDSLQQRGITEKNLQMAMAIENGYSPDFLLEQNRYKAFADLKSQEEVSRDVKESVVSQWLQSRDLFEDEIKERKDTYELNDEIFETDYNRAISYFDAQYKEFEKQNELATIQRERAVLEIQKKNRDLLQSVETKGEISGEKMTATQLEDFKRALRLQEEIVEIGGQPYKASKFDKFIHDIQNNFETQLLAFKLVMFRDMDRKMIEQEAEGKAEESLFKGITSRLTKNGKLTAPASTVRKSADGTRTFEIPKNAKVVTLG